MFGKILLPYLNLLYFEVPSGQLHNYLPVHNAMNIALSNQHKLVVLFVLFSEDDGTGVPDRMQRRSPSCARAGPSPR
jgi:hypothetical protein